MYETIKIRRWPLFQGTVLSLLHCGDNELPVSERFSIEENNVDLIGNEFWDRDEFKPFLNPDDEQEGAALRKIYKK